MIWYWEHTVPVIVYNHRHKFVKAEIGSPAILVSIITLGDPNPNWIFFFFYITEGESIIMTEKAFRLVRDALSPLELNILLVVPGYARASTIHSVCKDLFTS